MRRRVNVVVFVSLVLVCGFLALAAISRARDAAKRTSCVNNLRSLAIALFDYEDANRRFPRATVSEANLAPEKRLSCFIEILPYVEAGPRFPYDETKPWDAEENRPRWFRYFGKDGQEHQIYWGHHRLWICPSKPNEATPGCFSLTYYVGIAGIGVDAVSRSANDPAVGFFGYDRTLCREDIKNDLANTLMVIETGHANGPWTASGYPTVRGIEPDDGSYVGQNAQFGGLHRGGANALFADGAVRFLSDDISRSAFEAMASISRSDP